MHLYRAFFQYFIAVFLGLAFFYMALFYLQLGVPTEDSRSNQQWVEKKYTYAQLIHTKKLVLVSGSNTLFGVDTEQMERVMEMPTVNMGTNAGFGLKYILRMGLDCVAESDIVVLPLEYSLYKETNRLGTELITYILGRDPVYFENLPALEQLNLIVSAGPKRILHGIKARIRPDALVENNPYDGKYLNANGDMTNNAAQKKLPYEILLAKSSRQVFGSDEYPSADALAEIRKFIMDCRAKRVLVLATFPAFLSHDRPFKGEDLAAVRRICTFYEQEGVPVLGTYEESLYDAEDFYDTVYHLNEVGKEKRTRQMIAYLRPYLERKVVENSPIS